MFKNILQSKSSSANNQGASTFLLHQSHRYLSTLEQRLDQQIDKRLVRTFFDLFVSDHTIIVGSSAHIGKWSLPTDDFCHHLWNQFRIRNQLSVLLRELVHGVHAARHSVTSCVVATHNQQQ